MRTRLVLPAALATAALVIVPALPAAAAMTTWTSPTDSNWSTASWQFSVPTAGDDIIFDGGPRSTYDLGDVSFESISFQGDHLIANGGGVIALTRGLLVAAGVAAEIQPGLATNASQTWTVRSGGTLTLPSQVDVAPGSILTLEVDGTLAVSSGNLDGAATACITASGSGVLSFSSGGGGVGTCPGFPNGLVAATAETTITPGTNLGGKDFVAAGGLFTGGSTSSPSTVRQLSLVSTGTVSPGVSGGTAVGTLDLWGTSTWTDGTYLADLDAAGTADLVAGRNQAITVSGTTLSPRLLGSPTAGQSWTVLSSDIAVTASFESPAGAPLVDGDEFEANGQVFSISYSPLAVDVTWLRAVPAVVVPPTAPAATLPATGAEGSAPAALLAVSALLAGIVMVAASRRRSAGA